MPSTKTLISTGDFIDLGLKIRQKGIRVVLSKLNPSAKSRTVSKWNSTSKSTDFWIIPSIRKRWNQLSTGDPNLEYEDYVVNKYFASSQNLSMLSVGCGSGTRERKFAKYPCFKHVVGIDMAERKVYEARRLALSSGHSNIEYLTGNFLKYPFEPNKYDLILFNSSLHHLDNVESVLGNRVHSLLKDGGMLLLFEYVGPNRLQYTQHQLDFANRLLKQIPKRFRVKADGSSVKTRIYRPGILRMLMVDPSEAIDSESILPAVRKHFKVAHERMTGGDISMILFKDIAHNFLGEDDETQNLIAYLLGKEDEYLEQTGSSDGIFGVYYK